MSGWIQTRRGSNSFLSYLGVFSIPVDEQASVGDLVMLLSPWGKDTGVMRIVLSVDDHIMSDGVVSRFLCLDDDTTSWPVSYVRILSKAKK